MVSSMRTKNARMETSQHGQIVPKEHSKGGFVSCSYLEGFEGDRNDVDAGRKYPYGLFIRGGLCPYGCELTPVRC